MEGKLDRSWSGCWAGPGRRRYDDAGAIEKGLKINGARKKKRQTAGPEASVRPVVSQWPKSSIELLAEPRTHSVVKLRYRFSGAVFEKYVCCRCVSLFATPTGDIETSEGAGAPCLAFGIVH